MFIYISAFLIATIFIVCTDSHLGLVLVIIGQMLGVAVAILQGYSVLGCVVVLVALQWTFFVGGYVTSLLASRLSRWGVTHSFSISGSSRRRSTVFSPVFRSNADMQTTLEPQTVADSPHRGEGKPRKTLTSKDLSHAIWERRRELSEQEAHQVLETLIEEMTAALVDDGALSLQGFGTFTVRENGERSAGNSRAGAAATMAARTAVAFKASPLLKNALNERRRDQQ